MKSDITSTFSIHCSSFVLVVIALRFEVKWVARPHCVYLGALSKLEKVQSVIMSDPAMAGEAALHGEENRQKNYTFQELEKIQVKTYRKRWLIVFLFATYSGSNNFQWIHLNIIGNVVLRYYNESIPGDLYRQQVAIDWLSMVYMICYIPLIFPATYLLDKKGLRIVAILGSLGNALGAWLKCAAVSPDRFGVLMFAQTVCAVAQIFILGMPAYVASTWFGPSQVSTATAIGVFGSQVRISP